MNTVKVFNDLPRMLTFNGGKKTRGKRLDLLPVDEGNIVDKDVFKDKLEHDKILRHLFDEGAVRIEGDAKLALSDEVLGTQAPAVPSANVRPASQKPAPEDPAPAEPIAPKKMGGAVPGNIEEAKELVAQTGDVDVLNRWLENERRVKVKRALRMKIGEIGIGNEPDA
jgi:hypothetical protein